VPYYGALKTFLRAGVSLVFLALAGQATAQTVRTILLPAGSKMQVVVPMGYSFNAATNPDGSVRFKMENPVWGIVINALVVAESDPSVMRTEWQQNKLITFVGDSLSISKEKDYIFRPLNPDSGSGVFCTLSAEGADESRPAEPGAATRLTGGLRAWPGRVVVFRITSSSLKSEEYLEAFNIFRTGLSKK
jgi:hypothetical protein